MKNRAALLALIVLAIATLLMLFVVLPQLSGNKDSLQQAADKATETVKQATEKAAEAAPQAVAQLKEKATATLEKMDRIGGGANEAVASLAALFDKGRLPTAEEFTAARQKAETALTDLAAIDLPEGIGGDLRANAQKMRDDAVKAIEWLKGLPADPTAAAAVIGKAKELFPFAFKSEPEAPKTETAKAPDTAPVSALPSFDVLRVEPDGSTVIAGRAAPGVTIEIVSGETVLTRSVTGPGGEFAAVLDNPLPPGDHQLALRAAGADGSVTLSGEVATVSVPKDKDGQLLAMISTPGQASRLLTIPSAQGGDVAKPADTAAAAPASSAPQTTTPTPAGTPPAGTAPEVTTPAATAPVRVSAVEIENDRIFVAGSANAGATIRAFAGNNRIGEVTVDPSGHFVVDGTVPLAPGDHLIVVEMLDEKGNVAMKVSVPFNRPEGNQVSAIAGDAAPAPAETVETPDTKALATLRANVTKAYALLKSLFADGKVPGKEELAAARSATEFALKALGDFVPDVGASDTVKTQGAEAAATAGKALAALAALPKDAASLAKTIDSLAGVMGTVTAPAIGTPAPATDPKTLSQAPLTPSDNAVIIRRGDTLWQISRRVYGQGVRYTTIYLANRGEINNPDLIEPGQVFTVPKDALPNAEELHRKRMSGEPLQ